jgi:acetylornithine deacetylase/succinyl-diaminopimelate desuccinylase-like protein
MNKALNFLNKIISFQSVSTDLRKEKEIFALVKFLKNFLEREKFKVKIIGEKCPLFIAEKFISSKAKTIGIYSHYDVQPAEPLNLWHSNPFSLTIKNGKIFARGVADDKGHLTQNIFAVLHLIKENKLKNNIIFIFEGEEEIGSKNFSFYINQVSNILKNVDLFFLTDVGMVKKNIPTIYYALRGIVYFEIEVWTGKKDLHSGVYGNLVYNPSQILFQLFSKMRNLNGEVKIPNFYKRVRKISEKEKKIIAENVKNLNEIKKVSEVYTLNPFDKKYPSISAKIHPSLEVNGFYSGYIEEGLKTIIPNYAKAKFSIRLIEYQEPKEIILLVKKFIRNNIPKGIKYSLKVLSSARPFFSDYRHPYIIKTAKILEEEFKNKCVFMREGGSIPAAEILMNKFKKPVILTGFILEGANIHAPNENMRLELFEKGIKVLSKIYNTEF